MMKRYLLNTVIIFIIFYSISPAQPELEIPDNRFEFGLIPHSSTVVHYFWFKSIGTDTLVIDNIKTGCSCAIMPLEKNQLPPGDSLKVGIYWDVKRRLDKVGRYPSIFTNASSKPYRLYLTGSVLKDLDFIRPVTFSPYKFEMSRYDKYSIDSLSYKIRNVSDRNINITRVSFPLEECELYLPDSINSNSEIVCYIKVKPEYIDKEFKRSITIQLDDAKNTRITIPIRRKIY